LELRATFLPATSVRTIRRPATSADAPGPDLA
jgi:hypothetical protein